MLTQINASAGSGKTYTLTRRFLELLTNAQPVPEATGCALSGNIAGYSLAEILAATFTNKAAAEMKSRVIAGLKEEALRERALGTRVSGAHEWVNTILRHYNSLNIRTIDSLLASLVRLSTLQLRIPPDFEPSFNEEDYLTPTYDALMDELTAELEADAAYLDSFTGFAVGDTSDDLGPEALNSGEFNAEAFNSDILGSDLFGAGALGSDAFGAADLEPDTFEPEDLKSNESNSDDFEPDAFNSGTRGPDAFNSGTFGADDLGTGLFEPEPELFPEASGTFLTSDGATLRSALAGACRSLLYLKKTATGFTPRKMLYSQVSSLVERMLRAEETPSMNEEALHKALHSLHSAAVEKAAVLQAIVEKEGLKANRHFYAFLANCVAHDSAYRIFPTSQYKKKSCLDECLNKASVGNASDMAERAFEELLEAIERYESALPLLSGALQLAPLIVIAKEIHARMLAGSMGKLLPALLLPSLAGRVLSGEDGVSDALCRMGTRLSQMLLDEFQDTSREQWAAISPLAEEALSTGGSLTYVGDVKQAIYGWRGGDAALFNEVADSSSLTAIAPNPQKQRLEYNWRSHPAIVQHNNEFFSLLADEEIAQEVLTAMLPDGTPPEYCVQAAREAAKHFAHTGQAIPPQKDWAADKRSEHAKVRLYHVEGALVGDVHELVKERLQTLLFDELLPVWKYRDIAFLVRTGDEASLVANWLAGWQLPVVTENSFLLSAHPLIGRLISFLTFLDYPLDDLSFWEFVSGPELFCPEWFSPPAGQETCRSETAATPATAILQEWLASVTSRHKKRRPPLYTLFRNDFPGLWERYIAPFHSESGLMSAYDTLSEAIVRFSLMERSPDCAPFLRRLLEIAYTAESRGQSSLASFLSFWKTCEKNEKLPLPESMDAVRILTIHKAKGLEFPVVILPFQHKGSRREPDLAVVNCCGMRILTPAVKAVPELHYPACITDELERLNLLYVAWTRPVYALHSFITRPKSSSTPLMSALEILLEQYQKRLAKGASAPGEDIPYIEWEEIAPSEDQQESTEAEQDPTEDWRDPFYFREEYTGEGQAAENDQAINEKQQTHSEKELASEAKQKAAEKKLDGIEKKLGPIEATPAPVEEKQAAPPYHCPPQASLPWRPMNWLPRLKIYRSPLPEPQFSPRQRGILAHLCLENLVLTPSETHTGAAEMTVNDETGKRHSVCFPSEKMTGQATGETAGETLGQAAGETLGESVGSLQKDVERAVRQGIRLFPLPLDDPEKIAQEMREALLWFASLPQANLWLSTGMREQGIMDEQGRMHRVDLLAEAEDGLLHAVDYKTGGVYEAHKEQVLRYMRLSAEATGKKALGFLVYLDEKRLVEV